MWKLLHIQFVYGWPTKLMPITWKYEFYRARLACFDIMSESYAGVLTPSLWPRVRTRSALYYFLFGRTWPAPYLLVTAHCRRLFPLKRFLDTASNNCLQCLPTHPQKVCVLIFSNAYKPRRKKPYRYLCIHFQGIDRIFSNQEFIYLFPVTFSRRTLRAAAKFFSSSHASRNSRETSDIMSRYKISGCEVVELLEGIS